MSYHRSYDCCLCVASYSWRTTKNKETAKPLQTEFFHKWRFFRENAWRMYWWGMETTGRGICDNVIPPRLLPLESIIRHSVECLIAPVVKHTLWLSLYAERTEIVNENYEMGLWKQEQTRFFLSVVSFDLAARVCCLACSIRSCDA